MIERILGGFVFVLFIFACTFYDLGPTSAQLRNVFTAPISETRKALVVASLQDDDVSWLAEFLPEWERNIYVMDNPGAPLTVAQNKGPESTAYLTYIIDSYDDLPAYAVFLHALRYQWHNEDPMYDGVPMIRRLRLSHVDEVGYANLRCTWTIGCPSEIQHLHPNASSLEPQAETEAAFLPAFREFFPELSEPSEVGVGAGAQFALSRAQILKRPLKDYKRIRRWLWETELDDATGGRVLEYSWHLMMGKPAVHCPTAEECFCGKYGLCELDCTELGDCGRYLLPRFAVIPSGWPDSGQEGQDGWPTRDWWL